MPDILTIGEALVHLVSTQAGVPLRQAALFEKSTGGAPLYVAVGLARLGVSAGFMGRVGDDPLGHFLADTLAAQGVEASQLGFERRARTGLAFVSSPGQGAPEIAFFRSPSAAALFSPGHVNPNYVKQARAIVYNSSGLSVEPCRSGVLKALAIAREAGALRVYDINLDMSLWGSEPEARYGLRLGLERADLVNLSLDELEFLGGTGDLSDGMQAVWADGMRLLVTSLGAQGCAYRTTTDSGRLPGCQVDAVDSSGAGAAFLAGLLAELLAGGFSFERPALERALRFANAASALTAAHHGVLPALPTRPQVEAFCQ